MLRLIKWLVGFVSFRFSGGFNEGFINACFEHQLNISNISYKGSVLYADCPAALYPYLRPLAKENGGILRVVKRKGLVFRLLPFRSRWGLLIGIVACLALAGFLNGFIWSIEVTGAESLEESRVLLFLEENGFHEGVHWQTVDRDYLESLMLASFDECAWVHINREGTKARVEIGESVAKPEVIDTERPANLKAAKDGTIIRATVYEGWQEVRVGEGVTRGDILVSGVYESEHAEANMFTHARGEYIAEVEEPFSLTVSRTQEYKSYYTEREYKSVQLFGLDIPLYIGSSDIPDADISEEYRYVILNNNKLPVGIKIKSVRPFAIQQKQLSDSELTALTEEEIKKRLEAEFSGAEIVEQNIEIALASDSAAVTGTLLCHENIGEEIEIVSESSENEEE